MGSELTDILGITYVDDNENTLVFGVDGTFTEGQIFTTPGTGGADNQTSRDRLATADSTTTRGIYAYGTGAEELAGVAYSEGPASAVFLGFGWEAIFSQAKRDEVLDAILGYFEMPEGMNLLSIR